MFILDTLMSTGKRIDDIEELDDNEADDNAPLGQIIIAAAALRNQEARRALTRCKQQHG